MEYTALESQQYYSECKALTEGLGYALVELHIVRIHSGVQVRAVIAPLRTAEAKVQNRSSIGVNDCAKVHRLLLPRLEALLRSQEVYMENSRKPLFNPFFCFFSVQSTAKIL